MEFADEQQQNNKISKKRKDQNERDIDLEKQLKEVLYHDPSSSHQRVGVICYNSFFLLVPLVIMLTSYLLQFTSLFVPLIIKFTSYSYLFSSLLSKWTFSQHHWPICFPITFCTLFSAYITNPIFIYKYQTKLMYSLSLFLPSCVTSNFLPQLTSLLVCCKNLLAKTASFTTPGQTSLKTLLLEPRQHLFSLGLTLRLYVEV